MMSEVHQPVNIGNPRELTVLEFAREIIRLTGARSKIVFKPLPQDDPKQRRPDISKAQQLLDWQPKIDLETGLKLSLDYFRQAVAAEAKPAAAKS